MMNRQKTECTLLRDFERLTKAGSGGFGVVLRGKKKNENFYSAIKLVPMDVRMGYETLSEAKKIAAITKHDSVVRCIDYWEDACTKAEHDNILRLVKLSKDDKFFYFPTNQKQWKFLCIRMEFCENGTLKNWLKNRKSVDLSENLEIFLQIARGVEHIHANKLIHRDIKPANILFCKKNAKISDFGWSAIHNTGEYMHTPGAGAALYQAPEQACGIYGQTSDYYALGLILFELFHPDAQKNVGLSLTNLKYTRQIPKEIANNYPTVATIIQKMISVESTERPNCALIVATIKQLLDTSKPQSKNQSNYKCNGCKDILFGTRYKCSVCPKYFLCESCEEDVTDHPETHKFLKIKKLATENAVDNNGCQHYRRKCKIKCPIPECGSSNGFYFCRICHDEDIKGHKMDRFRIEQIMCTFCGLKQSPRKECLLCTTSFSKYFCSICNLFDDSEEADEHIFHCFLCGICRKKNNKLIQYKHCDNCAMCYPHSIMLEDCHELAEVSEDFKHECYKEAGKTPCSVCHKNVHDSREAAILVDCHHYVHLSCRSEFPDGISVCPLCGHW